MQKATHRKIPLPMRLCYANDNHSQDKLCKMESGTMGQSDQARLDGGFYVIAIMLREFATCACRRTIAADQTMSGPLPAVFRYFAAIEAGARRPFYIGSMGVGKVTNDEVAILNALAVANNRDQCEQRLCWLIGSSARADVLDRATEALAALTIANLQIEPRLQMTEVPPRDCRISLVQ